MLGLPRYIIFLPGVAVVVKVVVVVVVVVVKVVVVVVVVLVMVVVVVVVVGMWSIKFDCSPLLTTLTPP